MLNVLYLIVARGGSKGVPGKNLRRLGGLSLVGFKARSAQRVRHSGRIIISTDSTDIQAEARSHGVEVPFTRPVELATDTAASVDVVLHAMDHVEREEGRSYDAVMLLEPSSPFSRAQDYDAAIDLYQRTRADLVVGVKVSEVNSIFCAPLGSDGSIGAIVERLKDCSALRRQDMATEYTLNGGFYLIGWEYLRRTRQIYSSTQASYGVPMDRWHSIEIDTPFDMAFAEFVVEKGLVDMSSWL